MKPQQQHTTEQKQHTQQHPHTDPTTTIRTTTSVANYSNISEVSGRKLRFRAKIPKWKRLEVIREKIGLYNTKELALFAGVTERCMLNDLKAFYATEEYRDYIRDEVHKGLKDEEIPKTVRFTALVSIYRDILNGKRSEDVKEVSKEDERLLIAAVRNYDRLFSSSKAEG